MILRKIISLILLFLSALLTLPIIIFLRLIRPFLCVRFGPIRSDAIGNSIFYLNYYLTKKELDNLKTIDLFYFDHPNFPNAQWALMARRYVRINQLFYYFDRMNNFLPGGRDHFINPVYDDLDGLLYRSNQQFKFTEEEETKGRKYLQDLGLSPKDKFVTLITRDSSYKECFYGDDVQDFSYHNYRNSDINRYKKASVELAKRGYWVLRMGKKVSQKFEVDSPFVQDYANSEYQSDFLDIWLMAKCNFCITTGTGTDMIASIFRRPVLYVNFIPISNITNFLPSTTIPKKLIWKDKNKTLLTLNEMLLHNYNTSIEYNDAFIDIVELDPREINEAVMEMVDRIEGNINDNEESIKLQYHFWSIFKSSEYYNSNPSWFAPGVRIGNAFLKGNKSWFLK